MHAIKPGDNPRALYFLCVPRISQFAQLAYIIGTDLLQHLMPAASLMQGPAQCRFRVRSQDLHRIA
jgi:hypothetical protein